MAIESIDGRSSEHVGVNALTSSCPTSTITTGTVQWRTPYISTRADLLHAAKETSVCLLVPVLSEILIYHPADKWEKMLTVSHQEN
jgi:hypothetical protein